LVARATPARHGVDGYIEWLVDPAESTDDHDGQPINFYNRSSYVMVEAGQVVGRIIAPILGEDGRDVLGRTLAARSGKAASLTLNETIMANREGQLLAQQAGVLVRTGDAARIDNVLDIPEFVDFSTGNISFDGNVCIHKGIRDLFVVQATGNVDVHGLIEAATVDCGGNMIVRGGMAGRERGQVAVGGDMVARYLDRVCGQIHGELRIEHEVINCNLTIHGSVQSPQGSIIGGRLIVVGAVVIGTLGSDAGVPTSLLLGTVPTLETPMFQLDPIIEQLTAKRDALLSEQKQLGMNRRLNALVKERQTEILYELQQAEQYLTRATVARQTLEVEIGKRRTIDVTIDRRLYHGVMFTVGPRQLCIEQEQRGPVRIRLGSDGQLMFARGDGPAQALSQIAKVHTLAT
jgi:hypothetical protein